MVRSNLIPYAFKWEKSENVHFSITVKAEIIIPAKNVYPNETMVLYKYQRSYCPMTFHPRPLILDCHIRLFLRNHWAFLLTQISYGISIR